MSISASLVNELRNKTGAGMMDCKKALEQTNGDIEKAIEYLRKRGVQQAEKKVGRSANQGIIQSYIHPGSRLGVLVEINCETDFVARTNDFQEFAKDVAMQIAAANPLVVDRSEVDQEKIEKEMEIYRAQAREQGKPENIVEKMAQGKLEKFYQEVCLLEQSFVKDPTKTIRDLLNEKIAKLGENMILRRFVRFQLGE
ncbi:MAG TPA: translation elongation factor Ts [bacterium]|nr:translation elongation factor Ts [bacterium]HQG44773.1 translation elongation factor Ts [bacterium]HQI48239.1 translation elongation factor Ts [bacterium]HQJ65097.1 translation elongation factor Ts [bacterium]